MPLSVLEAPQSELEAQKLQLKQLYDELSESHPNVDDCPAPSQLPLHNDLAHRSTSGLSEFCKLVHQEWIYRGRGFQPQSGNEGNRDSPEYFVFDLDETKGQCQLRLAGLSGANFKVVSKAVCSELCRRYPGFRGHDSVRVQSTQAHVPEDSTIGRKHSRSPISSEEFMTMPPRKLPYRTHPLDRQEIKADDGKPLNFQTAFTHSDSGTMTTASPVGTYHNAVLSHEGDTEPASKNSAAWFPHSPGMLPQPPVMPSSSRDPTSVTVYPQSLFQRQSLSNSLQRLAFERVDLPKLIQYPDAPSAVLLGEGHVSALTNGHSDASAPPNIYNCSDVSGRSVNSELAQFGVHVDELMTKSSHRNEFAQSISTFEFIAETSDVASKKMLDGGYLRSDDLAVVRDVWKCWWEDYCIDVEAFATTTAYLSVSCMSECLAMSRSARIYPRLIAYTYVRLDYPFKFSSRGDLDRLRKMHAEWSGWDDHECLLRHHTIRMKLWNLIGPPRKNSESAVPGCRLKCVIGSDMDDIRRMVERVLENRELKDKLLESCIQDPVPVINLLQTLLDDHNLTDNCKRSVVRMMARIAKKSGRYPDCLVLEDVRPVGAHPVAGGGFADVWKGNMGDGPGSIPVSLKVFRVYSHSVKEKILQRFSHEAVIWRQLQHANILPFYGVYTGGDEFGRLSLISPWMDAGNILDYLDSNPHANRISLLADVTLGLKYLHLFEPTVVHGDIKAANVLITPSLTACLADFGLASLRDSQGSTWDTTTEKAAGTLRWQAPELLLGDENGDTVLPNRCSDIYSFACLCIEVFTGKAPFMEILRDTVVVMTIMQKKIPKRPTEDLSGIGLDGSTWKMMELCWQSDPTLRPTIVQVAEYFNGRNGGASHTLDGAGDLPTSVRGTLGQYGFSDAYVGEIAHMENCIAATHPQPVDTGALESRIQEILDSPLTDLASISANLKHVERQLGKMNPTLFGNFLSSHRTEIHLVLSKVHDINTSHDSVQNTPDGSNEDFSVNSDSHEFETQDLPTLRWLYENGTITPPASITLYPAVESYLDRICLFLGDITRLQIDVIVTNSFLVKRDRFFVDDASTLDSAIHRRAGPGLLDECRTLGDWEAGSAKITKGYDLPAEYVIHTVGPHYYASQTAASANECLSSCYRESLNLAADNSLKSIAFPAISTGFQGFPMKEAAKIALSETRRFLDSDKGGTLDLVIFTLFDEDNWNIYRELLPEYFPLAPSAYN